MNEVSMLAAADTLKALRDEKSDLQAKLKDVQKRIDAVEAELIQLMTDEECTGFDRNGSRFSLVLKANNDDVLPDWLEGVIQVFEQPSIRVSKSKK